MKKLIDYDPVTGLKEIFHGSTDGETFTVETQQDLTPLFEANKAEQNAGFDKKSEWWAAATIPAVVQLEWITKYGIDLMNKDHWPGVKRLLNSSDYAHLRRSNFVL